MSEKELFGFIAESDGQIVIVFRGTHTTSDWISDAIARQTEFPYAKEGGASSTKGFSIFTVRPANKCTGAKQIFSLRKRCTSQGIVLVDTLTALCAADIATNTKFKNPSVYTYASPRAGNPAFASQFNRKTGPHYRIYNTNDIVP